jgi:hypothetical protein
MTIRAHCYQIAENSAKELESHRHGKLVPGEIFRFLFSQLAIKIVQKIYKYCCRIRSYDKTWFCRSLKDVGHKFIYRNL